MTQESQKPQCTEKENLNMPQESQKTLDTKKESFRGGGNPTK